MKTIIAELMSSNVATVPPSTSLEQCAVVMETRRISSLVITEGDFPVGILTERDMLSALSGELPISTAVEQVMGKPLVTVRSDVHYADAVRLFGQHKIRHLVVVDQDDKLVGIVSETDLCRKGGIAELVGQRDIAGAMDQNPVLLSHDTSLAAAAMWMVRGRQSSVFVVTSARPVGIITERDLVKQYRQGHGASRVDEIMSSPVATVTADQPLLEAVQQMQSLTIRHLAVVDRKGEIVAQLSENDVLKGVATA
jgi:CBS domain-containing protein